MINAMKSMVRKKLMFILVVLQLSFGLYMITSASSILIDKQIKKSNFAKLFNYNNTFVIKQMSEDKGQMGVDYFRNYQRLTKLETVFNDLKSDNIIKNAMVFFTFPCKIDGIDENANKKYLELQQARESKQFYQFTSKILVNRDFMNNYNIKIKNGRVLEDSDFNVDYKQEEIPILIGLDYRDKIKIGDTFKKSAYTYDSSKFPGAIKEVSLTFKVIGIMDKHAVPSLLAKSKFIENVIYSDSLVVIPTVKGVDDFSSGLSINDLGVFVELNDNANIMQVEDTINSSLKDTKLNVSSYSLKKDYENIMYNLKNDTTNALILGIILTLISVVGIISIIVGSLHKRKKEFGLRICLGATTATLCKEVFLEIVLMSLSALTFSYVILYFKTNIKTILSMFNILQLSVNILIILAIAFIISIAPILIIRRMEPAELLKSK